MKQYVVLNDGETFSSIDGCFIIETDEDFEEISDLTMYRKILIKDIIDPIRSTSGSNFRDAPHQN